MRLVLKSLMLGISGGLSVMMLALSFAPATPKEALALGPNHDRMQRVEMRLANIMLTVAPDFAVARMAQATDLPPDVVLAQLQAKADGTSAFPGVSSGLQETASVESGRRIDAGGALFVKAN